jgi:hypothetical protein
MQDMITVIGSSYFQPITDLIENLLKKPEPEIHAVGSGCTENGYSVSVSILLVTLLESYVARLKFVRNSEELKAQNTPDLVFELFPDYKKKVELAEVCLFRNIVVHNHVWQLDISDVDAHGAPTLKNPFELGFNPKRNYEDLVDMKSRRTRQVGLNVNPVAANRRDAGIVFRVIWETLVFMNTKSYSDTPLGGQSVRFRGKRILFGELIELFP